MAVNNSSGGIGNSGSITLQTGNHTFTTGNTVTLGNTMPGLTDKQLKKLKQLEADKVKWIKCEKLKSFKELPAHIRQEIVDEVHIKEFINNINNVDFSGFPDSQEMQKLQAIQNQQYTVTTTSPFGLAVSGAGGGGGGGAGAAGQVAVNNGSTYVSNGSSWNAVTYDGINVDANHHFQFKYDIITHEFTKEELTNAHADATIEETLQP